MTGRIDRHRRTAILLVVTIVAGACAIAGDLRDLRTVQVALTQTHAGAFAVHLDDRLRLRIDVFNAGLAIREGRDSAVVLEAIARTAYVAYPKRDSLMALTVGFTKVSGTNAINVTTRYPGRTWSGLELRALGDSISPP